jgi:ADP-heptose:LPS heptosyltransferase
MSNKLRKKTILFDKVFGELAFFALSPLMMFKKKSRNIPTTFKNILIIKSGGIGDYLLAIPTFKKIRAAYPDAEIAFFLFNRNKMCLEFYHDFNKVVVIDKPGNLISYLLKFKKYDLCIDLDQHRKIPSVLGLLSYAPVRIGFDNGSKGRAYTHPAEYREDQYIAQTFMNLLSPLALDKKIEMSDLILKQSTEKLPNSIAIYACAMKEDNRLSLEKWSDIIRKKGEDFTYYFIGGKADNERYDALQALLPGFHIERMDGKLSLSGSLELLSKCESMISEDGGTYHMGVVAGIPVTGYWLHGGNNMKKWGAPHADNRLIK